MKYSDEFYEQADVVFFGKLNAVELDTEAGEQFASFTVIESYKGSAIGELLVVNKLNSSCSRQFQNPDTAFYVYAKSSEHKSVVLISGFATFVPLGNALEKEWSPI
ncbi:MAG: hypothetical protein AAF756_12425 [Pseudomonadota bacterium]